MKKQVKSVWVSRWQNEADAPERRIIHGMQIKLPAAPESIRVGATLGKGYFKCGSEEAIDWITDFAVYAWVQNSWHLLDHITGLEKPSGRGQIRWFEYRTGATAYYCEIRRSGIDGWWPCYNIADTGLIIHTDQSPEKDERPVRNLHQVIWRPDEDRLKKDDIAVSRTSTEVRYCSPFYQIGFRLKSAGLAFFGLDGSGESKIHTNMLALGSILTEKDNDFFTQGPVINPAAGSSICGFLAYNIHGKTDVSGNALTYSLSNPQAGFDMELTFTMGRSSIRLDMKMDASQSIKLLDAAVFRIAFDTRKAPLTVLGTITSEGETGILNLPVTLNLPGFAEIYASGDLTRCRFNSIRPDFVNTFDLLPAASAGEDGCYDLKQGYSESSVVFGIGHFCHITLQDQAPDIVKKAFRQFAYTSLPFRADTATFSNNGNSMGAPICFDLWAELSRQIGPSPEGIDPSDYMRRTIEIHLAGAPAYASGRHHSGAYDYEDEYLMSGTAVLLGIARYLEMSKDKSWYEQYRQYIVKKIAALKKRDIDGDGLIESIRRRGVSGDHQWSTCWYDVISYGYKDAFANALLYSALQSLAVTFNEYGDTSQSQDLLAWSECVKSVYQQTFMTGNGWLAGWKCMKGQLHDYGFLAVNGAAVAGGLLDQKTGYQAISNLWQALLSNGYDSFDLGLPGNILDIGNEDMTWLQHQLPYGGYQNGGITLSQTRHFIEALYYVGMKQEADHVLHEICKGLLTADVIGGVGSGCDWRSWDGVASGYEGLLTDQFGFMIPLIKRYRS